MFRFTIRDVLWLTIVAAVVAAWVADRGALVQEARKQADEAANQRFAAERQRLRAALDRLGAALANVPIVQPAPPPHPGEVIPSLPASESEAELARRNEAHP